MSILSNAIEQLRKSEGVNYEHEIENIIFQSDTLMRMLESSKPLKRGDKETLSELLRITKQLYIN